MEQEQRSVPLAARPTKPSRHHRLCLSPLPADAEETSDLRKAPAPGWRGAAGPERRLGGALSPDHRHLFGTLHEQAVNAQGI